MAHRKEKEKPQAYIDYTSDSSASSPDEYSPSHFYDYWKRALTRTHRMSCHPISIKERALWKRLYSQYAPEDLIKMVDYWMNLPFRKRKYSPADFVVFYSIAPEIYDLIREKSYEWD